MLSFVILVHQPLFSICITSTVESAPFFIPSTSFCSLSSWFTLSYAYHLIAVLIFTLTIYHSLDLSLQSKNSSVSQILSSIFFLVQFRLPLRILNSNWNYWALALFVLVFLFLVTCVGLSLTHSALKSMLNNSLVISSPTAHLLTPLENISRPTYFHYHSRARNSSLLTL